jgi:SAM-dependent methyltransferase
MGTQENLESIIFSAYNPLMRWNTPLSEDHAKLLIDACSPQPGARILDLGCGWGELLMRMVTSTPGSSGDGVDTDTAALDRGRRLANERGLADRVRFHESPAAEWTDGEYDLVLNIGASHAWPDGTEGALRALRTALRPGGKALFGESFWAQSPSAKALEIVGTGPNSFGPLDELVHATAEAGFRPLHFSVADQREWDFFESTYLANAEQWALDNPAHGLRDAVLSKVDKHRDDYLAYRGQWGLAYLVLS